MRVKKYLRLSLICLITTFVFSKNVIKVNASPYANDQAVAGISMVLESYLTRVSETVDVEYSSDYDNLGIADVTSSLNVRKGPGESEKKIGNLPKDAGCEIIEMGDDGWAKIKSGKLEGYVKASYLITGEEAEEKLLKLLLLLQQ